MASATATAQRQGYAKDRGMGGGVAEIGHAPPHDEAAQRSCSKGDADTGDGGTGHEIIEHYSAASVSVSFAG
jgi:hypothetical protein